MRLKEEVVGMVVQEVQVEGMMVEEEEVMKEEVVAGVMDWVEAVVEVKEGMG
jgi:hypothetical protein